MAKADGNRDRMLKVIAETCGRRVELAKTRARQVKKERDEEAKVASRGILQRLALAEKRREELLSARGRRSSGGSPARRSDVLIRNEAAIRIQRVWRRYRLVSAVKEFQDQHITVESVTSRPFEMVVGKFRAPATVRATARLLAVLGLVKSGLPQKELDSLVRTFLSAYMILGHTQEVLHSHDQPLELVSVSSYASDFQDLISKARGLVSLVETHNHLLLPMPTLSDLWTSYLTAFQTWKSHDSAILVEMLVNKFVDLDSMLQDIQASSTMASVQEEYSQAIKSGQMLLLTKIRRLVGDETRNVVKRAVQASRRRRREQLSTVTETISDEVQEQVEIIEPPSVRLGLTNRRIMHELAINPDYEITPPEKTEDQVRREEVFKNTFYEGLLRSLRDGDQVLLPGVIADIKSRLLSLLQPSTPSYDALSEHLDHTIVSQQCQRNLFDPQKFISYVLNVMRQLCAPIRDPEVSSIPSVRGTDDTETFVLQVRRINEVLGFMALDSANFHLRLAKPALLAQATAYERTKFTEEVEKGEITLEKTTQWLESSAAQLNAESWTAASLWRNALINLLFDATAEIPETLTFDIDRLRTLHNRISSTLKLSGILLLAKPFSAGNSSRSLDFAHLATRLKVLETESAENIVSEIERFVGTPVKREVLLNMVRRVLSGGGDPCVGILDRRVRSLLNTVLSGGEISKNALVGMGLGEFESEVKEILGLAGVIGKVNWACYREFYEDIITKYSERMVKDRQ